MPFVPSAGRKRPYRGDSRRRARPPEDVVDYYIMSQENLLTVREVARRVHRSEETVRRWIWSGKLPARKLGNQLFVEAAELVLLQREPRVSESAVTYRPRGSERFVRGTSVNRGYQDTPILRDIRQRRRQVSSSKEELLRQIEEDEKFSDEMFAKYGFVDVADIFRELREEDD
jgi:excisionase family DNA binding protein